MTLRYRDRIIAHLGHPAYEPARVPTLMRDLDAEDETTFSNAIKELESEGRVSIDGDGRVRLPTLPDRGEIDGSFRANMRGFGFVTPDLDTRDGSIFIPAHLTGGALSGDKVRIAFKRDFGRERSGRGDPGEKSFSGEVVEVLKRRRSGFSGEVFQQGGTWMVQPDGRELQTAIVVRDAASKNVKPGDKVVVEITEYPRGNELAEGVITKVLGEAGRPDVETQAVIAAYDLPGEFPEECVEQAREQSRRFDEEIERWEAEGATALENRADETGLFIATIDPPDAKDYDDAISIRVLRRDADGFDGWEVGVHIADVAHFIERGSPLDEEAMQRGNSAYLPRLVIPMLPEVLSNGICSLQERVPRYAKSAFVRYDKQGKVRGARMQQSLIKSRKRLTYLEAQALIDGDESEAKRHAKTEANYTPELLAALKEMNACARTIERRRHAQGMFHLDLKEVELVFDEHGHVIDAVEEDDAYTHTLIEMFMVEANEVAARLFESMRVPCLRRVHPEPVPGDTDHLRRAANVAGFRIPAKPSREEIQGLLDATRGTPAAAAVHMAILRTLTKAEYSPAPIGHFALASSAYAHFTSPIRRYPDLTVHRALAEYLRLTDNGKTRPTDERGLLKLGRKLADTPDALDEQTLKEIGSHCSQTETNAESAERDLRQFLVLQLLAEKHVGEVFDGVITGVVPRGIFVQLNKYLADGMIQASDLPGDTTRSDKPPKWRVDDRTGGLVDAHSGRSYTMGDRVRVVVSAVDLTKRQLDLQIADAEGRAVGKAKGVAGLKLGGDDDAGGLGSTGGVKKVPGGQRRSQRSRSRDRRKTEHRREGQGGKGGGKSKGGR